MKTFFKIVFGIPAALFGIIFFMAVYQVATDDTKGPSDAAFREARLASVQVAVAETNQPVQVQVKERERAKPKKKLIGTHSFRTVNNNVGCMSKFSERKKDDLWRQKFDNHYFTWNGEITLISDDALQLKFLEATWTSDLLIEMRDESVLYDLLVGDRLTVEFRMTSVGGCFLPFMGDDGIIKS